MRRIVLCFMLLFAAGQGWALIGTPCDPEKDFSDVYLIRGWKNLPHKNQEETKARVDQVNARRLKITWKYCPEPNTPLYACLSYGAATMADWWALEMGWKLGSYRSYTHGQIESGFNPRKLEVRYRNKARTHWVAFAMTRLMEKDPITGEPVPIRPKGYAKLLVEKDPVSLKDYIDGQTFAYAPGDYPMEDKWEAVVTKNWNKASAEKKLKQALRDFGPLYVQFEMPGKHFLFGTHAPVVIGYGTLPGGKTAFICHDSFGNFPKNHEQDYRGAAAYRYVSADEIDEAIVFPHAPTARAYEYMGGIVVRFLNRGGKAIPVRRLHLFNKGKVEKIPAGGDSWAFVPKEALHNGRVMIYVEADYYMKAEGKGHWLWVPISSTK